MALGLAKLCCNALIAPALVVIFWPATLCACALWSAISSVSVCELKEAATMALEGFWADVQAACREHEAAIVGGLYLRGRQQATTTAPHSGWHQNAAPISLRRLPRMPLVRISHLVGLAAAAA